MDSYVYTLVDEMPVYPGGMNGLSLFLKKNIIYPPLEEKEVLRTKLLLSFIIDISGNAKAVINDKKGENSPVYREATRLAKLMSKWEPGKCNGKEVPVRVTIPMIISPQM